ncbi:MAG: hypothetical protein Q4C47_04770 [Planctomycetia bacterium]|nr:hypothetical protein [Planctomycetia bacterium]
MTRRGRLYNSYAIRDTAACPVYNRGEVTQGERCTILTGGEG